LAIPGALEGLVSKRSTQAAIVAARVLLPRLSRQMLTDATGKYSFAELLPGSYEVQFSAQGQTSQTTTTTIVDGQTTRLDVLLDP
jgi:protocatechuate 3,4-dioxygenase beta subunit